MESFRIEVEPAVLDDLRERLRRTRFPDQLDDVGWEQGTELGYLRSLCTYWSETFDWRAQERALQAFPHHRVPIRGRRLHFIHAPSPHPNALPLLLTHGWPSSVIEFLDLIEPLTHPEAHGGLAEDAFHVVCPSLPGYGWSEAPRARGWGPRRIAEVASELMQRLGYARYVAHGGDWGSVISTWLGAQDPNVAGLHLTMPLGNPRALQDAAGALSDEDRVILADLERFRREETAYQEIQGTKPQSLGYALQDSPAGLAAWIVEKFRSWSDCGGDVESRFDRDRLLANITLYWVTASITSSLRIYYEMRSAGSDALPARVDVPTACAIFPHDILRMPRSWVEARYRVSRWTAMPSGGHFPAIEEPALLIEDLRAAFRALR